jgi:hypothetical protein
MENINYFSAIGTEYDASIDVEMPKVDNSKTSV